MSTPTRTPLNLYSDFRMDFAAHPVSKKLMTNKNEDAIKAAIKKIVLTDPYEVPWNPNFGSGVRQYLFDPVSKMTELNIQTSVLNTLKNYEPRAQYNVLVSVAPDNNSYNLTIIFETVNSKQPITVKILLNRIR